MPWGVATSLTLPALAVALAAWVRQAGAAGRRRRRAGDPHRQAAPVPGAGVAGRVLRPGAARRHVFVPAEVSHERHRALCAIGDPGRQPGPALGADPALAAQPGRLHPRVSVAVGRVGRALRGRRLLYPRRRSWRWWRSCSWRSRRSPAALLNRLRLRTGVATESHALSQCDDLAAPGRAAGAAGLRAHPAAGAGQHPAHARRPAAGHGADLRRAVRHHHPAKALTQIVGFLVMENGIALLAVLGTYGVPLIIELGVFLDVLMGSW